MKKRKQWPFVALLYAILSPLLLLNFVSFAGAATPPYMGYALFWIGINLVFVALLWLFAYKNGGNKLLTTYLIIAPFIFFDVFMQLCGFTIGLYTETFGAYTVSFLDGGPWGIKRAFFVATYLGIFLLFYTRCLALRKENKILKMERQSEFASSPQFKLLEEAKTLEILDHRYRDLVIKWPQFEPLITSKYKTLRKALAKE